MRRFYIIRICAIIYTLCAYNILYTLPIPFELIGPTFSWRHHTTQLLYDKANLTKFKTDMKRHLTNTPYVMSKNDYPYNVNAEHFILWLQNTSTVDIERVITLYFGNIVKTKWYENPVYKKSIPEIRHIHIFVS